MSAANDIFRLEVTELLSELEDSLMDLEDHQQSEQHINTVFRVMHTIKGTSGMFGFEVMSELTHYLEEIFDHIRDGKLSVTAELVDLSLRAKDEIAALLNADPQSGIPSSHSLIQTIIAYHTQALNNTGDKQQGAPLDNADNAQTAATQGALRFDITVAPNKESLLMGLNPLPILRELSDIATDFNIEASISPLPSLADYDPELLYLAWSITMTTDRSQQDLEDIFLFVGEDWQVDINTVEALPSPTHPVTKPDKTAVDAGTNSTQPDTESASPASQHVKVNATRLDELMDRVGELVISHTRLHQLALKTNDLSLLALAEDFDRMISDLRDTALSMRMVQVSQLFSRFRRLVRDTSSELDKKVKLECIGEQTELDKTVVDRLSDPMVHLIRNSLDHGIESPQQRAEQNKPEEGTILLEAKHQDSQVVITIHDDGGGICPQRIREKAIKNGLISESDRLSEQEILQLIFEPGFSTAEEVSKLSGRGVGMDAVKSAIEGLNGRIKLNSAVGQGTQIDIILPLTMAIIDGLHVSVGPQDYIIPLSAVSECMEINATESSEEVDVLNLRGQCIPQIGLRNWFGIDSRLDDTEEVVIVKVNNSFVGFVVDHVVGQQQTVVKVLSPVYQNVRGVSGATILGDGNVALILDIENLTNEVTQCRRASLAPGLQ